ncbi:hypothetical protein GRI97_11925 [Altererythrobacter xixiisoli]|uniref:Lipoprotein-related protein n=1 Tax=Croceibacterium xixiisoli TaxID=1476466 RepID=A0A6I4TYH9_9SPHN|nr:YbaY family lipoprotein [Croceibacterium xixiisoli]MXO99698.1 hypothetical protein [Croceibacterium xixiisoli]
MIRSLSMPIVAIAMLAGCMPEDIGNANRVTLTGTVAYRERMALPDNARISVQLADVSRADAPATIVAQTSFRSNGRQVPIPFTLQYNPNRLQPNGRYTVSARITGADGTLMFITDTHNALQRPGQPMALNLVSAGGRR